MKKRRKTKAAAIIAMLMFVVLALCACTSSGGKNASDNNNSANPSDSGKKISEASEPTKGSQDGKEDDGKNGESTIKYRHEDNEMMIVVFSIGKADSILIQFGERNVLIDTGESGDFEQIMKGLADCNVKKLDMLLITHFDKDHVGSASRILSVIPTDRVLYPDYEGSRSEYYQFINAISDHPDASAVSSVTDYDFGIDEFRIYPASDPEELLESDDPDNNMSLVCRLVYGESSFVFAGDIEKKRIKQILDDGTGLSCNWLKMPHHGKFQKILKDFIDLCSPEYAVITDSADQPADEKTISYLTEKGIKIYHAIGENVVTRCDGKTVEVAE